MGEPAEKANMQTLLTAFRQLGLPLLQAASEAQNKDGAEGEAVPVNTQVLGSLVESTVSLSQKLAAQAGASEESVDAWVRWALSGAAAQVVGSAYKTTGRVLTEEESDHIATIAIELQSKFKAQIPAGQEALPNTVATFRAKMLEAMVPVVGAVAQYSFGRSEHALLAEVAEKLVKTADQVTRSLAPTGASPEEWRLLCWNVVKAAGQIYTESHFAEADRLLYMDADERATYFAQHGQIVPMQQVWQSFNQRMAMLATLAAYLDVPESARVSTTAAGNPMLTAQAFAACILLAANTYHVPAAVMIGIMHVEGGRVGQEVGPNVNGTYDLGPMQVNTRWLPMLAQNWSVNVPTARKWVRDDGCVNVHVAAWILRQKMDDTGSIWGGIAGYHSMTPSIGGPYASKVVAVMDRKGLVKHDVPLYPTNPYPHYAQK